MRLILDVRLCEIKDPIVWRKIAIPTKLTFESLHLMLQAAMGWENQHLYSFHESPNSRFFRVVSKYSEEFGMDGTRIAASSVLWDYLNQYTPDDGARSKLCYEYDYGDSWEHEIDVIELDRSSRTSPELLDGGGACPPENCGGIPGFERLKDYLSGDLSSEEYYNWFTAADAEEYDVDKFDLERMRLRVKGWNLMR